MNAEPTCPSPTKSTDEAHPLSLPVFFTSSSSSLKPLRERNKTNLKRRINLSRSQVLSEDFENEDNLSIANTINKTTLTSTNSQQPSTPIIHANTEIYGKTASPRTPSPIHTTVTCSQVWERLASNEDHQPSTLTKSTITPTTSTSSLPTHISFSYDPSDNDEDAEDLPLDDKDDFKYVPVSSQSKLVQFQFLAFARQQQLNSDGNNEEQVGKIVARNVIDSDEDEDVEEQEQVQEQEEEEEEEQENRKSKKRKRSISTANSLDDVSALTTANHETNAASSVAKPPCTKKPKIKDPNANFQRLNMRKKHFSHAKKHQFAKNKRNAFYRRNRYAGGNK